MRLRKTAVGTTKEPLTIDARGIASSHGRCVQSDFGAIHQEPIGLTATGAAERKTMVLAELQLNAPAGRLPIPGYEKTKQVERSNPRQASYPGPPDD